jgi:adenylate cyclase
MAEKLSKEEKMREGWRRALAEGDMGSRSMRRIFRLLPSSPRCGMCMAPFKGLGALLLKPTPFTSRSRKNPNWCKVCFEASPLGGAEVETGVLFADIRGFTSYSEGRSPEEVARLLNRFYGVATGIFAAQDAVIDKLAGDEVMALWLPGFAGRDTYIEKMLTGAEQLLHAVGFGSPQGPWLPLGLGLDWGPAFVGNVGSGEVKDFTALGDVVNTAARLQAQARPGQIVMSERVYAAAAGRYPETPLLRLELKGKSEPVAARIVDLADAAAAPVT